MSAHRKNPGRSYRKICEILSAWENLAPDAEFYGLSCAEFRAAMQPAIEVRERIMWEETRLAGLLQERARIDAHCLQMALAVVSGVRGDPSHGPNSSLYAAMGYICDSKNKRGRPRKRRNPQASPPPDPLG